MNFVSSKLHSMGEFMTPVLKNSKFKDTGVITAKEFETAGDFLAWKCPTWSWDSGEESKRRSYLSPDKQFLVTRNVPCRSRVKNMEYTGADELKVASELGDDDDEWVETHTASHAPVKDGDIQEIVNEFSHVSMSSSSPRVSQSDTSAADGKACASGDADGEDDNDDDDDDDVPDIGEFEEDNLVEDEAAATDDNILKTRTYDLYITYDNYYRVPRLWLFGYDENKRPLTVKQVYEDLSQDHAKKTVTMDSHPHLSLTMASIHPCRHSNVMKKIIEVLDAEGKELGVHLYLMIFLKFVQSVIPTIEYDFTREFAM